MAKTVQSYNLVLTLIELINRRYTGQITIMENPGSSGIIILMKEGAIYSIKGSEKEGIAALSQLVKWQRGFFRLEEVNDTSVFEGREPIKIEGLLRYMIEQNKLKRDEFVPIFRKTVLEYLMKRENTVIIKDEYRTLKDILDRVEMENLKPAVIYMASPDRKLLILLGENDSMVIGEKAKVSLQKAMKISFLHRFSYFIYPVKGEKKVLLLEELIEIMKNDVFQNGIIPYPPNPMDIREIIDSNDVVIFYLKNKKGLRTLPCVRGECFQKLEDFKRFFEKEVRYVAW